MSEMMIGFVFMAGSVGDLGVKVKQCKQPFGSLKPRKWDSLSS